MAERISNQEDTLSRLPYIANLKSVTALCSTVCMSIRKAKELSAAASPNLPAFSLPDQSPSGLGHFHRFSESLNSLPDTDRQALSESGQTMPEQTMPEMGATLGKVDISTDFQLQYLVNAPVLVVQVHFILSKRGTRLPRRCITCHKQACRRTGHRSSHPTRWTSHHT